jgi:hypothetical protein
MYNSWICINAYVDFVSVFIIGLIHNQQVCTTFISLSYTYIVGIQNVLLGLGFRLNDVMMQKCHNQYSRIKI